MFLIFTQNESLILEPAGASDNLLPMSNTLKVGDSAPPIQLQTDTGENFDLTSLRGRDVVLFFYPKADTPGCTVEAQEFRDAESKFAGSGTVILGISPD
ncbi:MAG TPA: redoxin domain-containing protein, partial [Bryobacteraceae bacterium]|nr:redoxin domain-containing protein [Bryobacteraceae bacterium]